MKHYAPEEIIRRSIVVQIELLLLAVIQQRYARHDEVGDERSQRTSLSSIDKTRPTENVEIARPEHVLRIGYASLWVYEVVRHEHLVPRIDTSTSSATCKLPSIPRKRVSER